jgi:hypothetical protein
MTQTLEALGSWRRTTSASTAVTCYIANDSEDGRYNPLLDLARSSSGVSIRTGVLANQVN